MQHLARRRREVDQGSTSTNRNDVPIAVINTPENELLMMIIRGVQQPAGEASPETGETPAGVPDPLHAQAAEEFAADVANGRMPSIRTIRARLHVGQPRAQLVRAYLATLATG
jgi:hypothetical protein